jgi:hypothetical protein
MLSCIFGEVDTVRRQNPIDKKSGLVSFKWNQP